MQPRVNTSLTTAQYAWVMAQADALSSSPSQVVRTLVQTAMVRERDRKADAWTVERVEEQCK